MQTIKRDIYVTKNVLQAPIEVTEGTNSIAIEFDVRDYDIPASAAAVAYSLSTSSMEEPNKALADVSGNKITIIPSEAFFLPGQNVMQVRIIDGNSKLISFNIIVKCAGKMRFGDEKEEQQSTLVEQMLAKLGEYQKKSASPYNFKGSCLSSELPASGNTINDTYYCTDLKYRKTWNGSVWEQSSLNEADYEDELTKTNGEVSSLKEDLTELEDREKWILLNGIDYDNCKDGKYYDTDGTFGTSDAYVYSEEYIAIKPSTLYQSAYYDGSFKYYTALAICFYDENKTFISQHHHTHNFTSPPNAKYVRISTQKEYSNKCMWYESNGNLPTEYKPFGYTTKYIEEVTSQVKTLSELLLNNSDNILYGKTLVCCGDSITWGADMEMGEGGFTDTPNIDCYWWTPTSPIDGSFVKKTTNVRMPYGYQIASRNGMTFFDAGVSGSTMQGLENKCGFSLENGRYTKLPDSIDYLCIFFGWNDAAYGTLGTIDDTTNESYYGGYNVVLPYLINKYPYTKICLIVPFGCTANHRNAIRLLANKWGVACFDMYKSGTPLYFGKESDVGVNESIVALNKAKFQANGAHPNYQGHNQISVMLEHFLRGI